MLSGELLFMSFHFRVSGAGVHLRSLSVSRALGGQGMTTWRVTVTGVVQGVGFRWFVREVARREGLAGWVRNRIDGSVELVASGDEEALSRLTEELRIGPPGARVRTVTTSPAEAEHPKGPFTIL
jgi:acylphosphatase